MNILQLLQETDAGLVLLLFWATIWSAVSTAIIMWGRSK